MSADLGALGPIGLGTASLARVTSDPGDFADVVDEAVSAGVRYVDTAPMYECGEAERLIGQALGRLNDRPVLSTKVGRLVRPLGADEDPSAVPPEHFTRGGWRTVFDFSATGVRASLRESLERLRTDRVDIVYVHDPEAEWDVVMCETIPAALALKEAGQVRAIGIGTNRVDRLEAAVREYPLDQVLIAGRYTLLDQSAESVMETCLERGTRVVIGGVFNSGILASPSTGSFDYRSAESDVRSRAALLAEVCVRHGADLMAAAIRFPLRHPAVAAVLLGPENLAQLRSTLTAARAEIPGELWHDLAAAGVRVAPSP